MDDWSRSDARTAKGRAGVSALPHWGFEGRFIIPGKLLKFHVAVGVFNAFPTKKLISDEMFGKKEHYCGRTETTVVQLVQ